MQQATRADKVMVDSVGLRRQPLDRTDSRLGTGFVSCTLAVDSGGGFLSL